MRRTYEKRAAPARSSCRELRSGCGSRCLSAVAPQWFRSTASSSAPSGRASTRLACRGAILHSLPGVGPVTLATLLTEATGPISRRDYTALRTLSGVAPVTKRSGKSCLVIMRYAAQVRLRNAVFHWARVAVLNDPKCRSRYAALRARGHSYGRAPYAVSPTGCLGWPACCCSGRFSLTQTTAHQRSRRPEPSLTEASSIPSSRDARACRGFSHPVLDSG